MTKVYPKTGAAASPTALSAACLPHPRKGRHTHMCRRLSIAVVAVCTSNPPRPLTTGRPGKVASLRDWRAEGGVFARVQVLRGWWHHVGLCAGYRAARLEPPSAT